MDAERERIERARAKNLAYIRQQDEQQASQAADELLSSVLTSPAAQSSAKRSTGNSSVYITGLSTYMACRQLEGVCSKIGKVRRVKFYKDERGGLKGDAVVTFASRTTMAKAVDRLNHFEVKPGVIITATEATFSSKKSSSTKGSEAGAGTSDVGVQEAKQGLSEVAAAPATLKPSEGSDAAFLDELEDDMRAECGKHGAVEHVQIVADGSVVVRFVELKTAVACLKVMNGRWFAGRQIEAQFDQSTTEDPGDPDTKVEAFLASLGE
ncbi:hypothetical protein KRP22_011547 [Phytophthora ramorum]|nr:HIV Tat-specific factor 1-like protein [Phytophthora ramorum]